MIRSTIVLTFCLLAPAMLFGQEPGGTERIHTVRAGETLADIAREYLGSASLWTRVHESNRELIPDPNRVPVGTRLRLPGPGIGTATVLGIGSGDREVAFGTGSDWEARRELLRPTAFLAGAFEEPGLEARTVFFDGPSSAVAGPSVVIQPLSEVPAFPEGIFHAAGWLIAEGSEDDRGGSIVAFASDQDGRSGRRTVHPHDEVLVGVAGTLAGAAPGERLLVFRIASTIPGVGRIALPTGVLEVSERTEQGVVARVVGESARMEIGDLVGPSRIFPLSAGVHPSDTDVRIEATVIAFQDRRELHLPGDHAFLAGGQDRGITVGDEFVAFGEERDGWAGREVARFQVVGVTPETSTVRVVSVRSPGALRPGLTVVLARKMP